MTILGIDPGTATTGYAIMKWRSKKMEVLDYGVILTNPSQAIEQRLKTIYSNIVGILKKHKPNILAIEKLYFFKNLKTALPVSEAKGVILLAAAQRKIRIKQFTPLEVKNGLCGYGRADKKQVQRMLKEILNLKDIPKPDDAADALAVALYCIYQHQRVLT